MTKAFIFLGYPLCKHLKVSFLFAIYMFIFLLSELLLNDLTATRIGADKVLNIYASYSFITVIGYVLFAFVQTQIKTIKINTVLSFIGIIAIIFLLLIAIKIGFFYFNIFTYMFFIGCFGCQTFAVASEQLKNSPYVGRVIGNAICLAVLAQFIVQKNCGLHTQILLLALGVFTLVALFRNITPEQSPISCKYISLSEEPHREGIIQIVAIILMSLILSINDGIITKYHAQGLLNVSEWPRLFYAIGIVCAGIIVDVRNSLYLPLSSLCGLLILTIAFSFLRSPELYSINLALMYFAGSFYIIYLSVIFIKLAPRTSFPILWAGMGRIARGITVAAVAATSHYFTDTELINLMLVDIAIVIFLLLLLFFNNLLLPRSLAIDSNLQNTEEYFKNFVNKYLLTEREIEVLQKVLTSGDTGGELAKELFISERVFQRHLTAIYTKTNTKSRIALCLLFYRANDSLVTDPPNIINPE